MSFSERFRTAEKEFLSALSSGDLATEQAFNHSWALLLGEFEHAIDYSIVDDQDKETAFSVASKVAILGEGLLKLQTETAAITSSYVDAIEDALAELSIHDVETPPTSTSSNITADNHLLRHTPPYISRAYSWLCENLHDPYPSSTLKRGWAKEAGITPRVMDDWFKSVRKAIGWVTLTKTHFKGSRSLAVSAAGNVFLETIADPSVPFEAQADFLAVKAKLDNLYLAERGIRTEPSTLHRQASKRARSVFSDFTATEISATTPTVDNGNRSSVDIIPTAPTSPYSPSSTRLPSLVFDPSDSEDEERIPELSVQTLLNDASIRIATLEKNSGDERLKRTW